MKLHSIFISALLITGFSAHAMEKTSTPVDLKAQLQAHVLAMETPPADLICAQAKLTSIINSGTLEQFKSALEQEVAHVKPTSFSADTHLRRSLSEHAKTLRQKKLTQLTTTISETPISTGIKAGLLGLIAGKGWSYFHNHDLIFHALILYYCGTWAYKNAHFIYYGNKPLIAEIKKLDDIILYLEQTTLLTASAAHSMETPPADLICAQAKLTNIITSGTLEQFKSALEQEVAHVKPTSFSAHTHLRRSLSEHAKTLHQQKLTQLTTTLSKSKIRAGVKAGFLGLIAAQLGFSFLPDSKDAVFTALILYYCGTWAYENAHFTYYGNKPLIAEIKKLEDIILYLEQTT